MDGISLSRRAAALAALPMVAGATLFVVVVVYRNAPSLLLALVGLSLGVAAAWWAITEFGLRRWLGVFGSVVGVVMVAFALFSAVDRPEHWIAGIVAIVVVLGATLALARYSLRRPVPTDGGGSVMVGLRPSRPVLLCNPWSGGGKVEQFGLAEVASQLGVEVVMLDRGLDLEQLTRDAVARGADCLGMAGGDGSQALVASVAIEHDLPFVCIPAGTRNHFALDLGLDRDDPRPAMAAFRDAVERRVDYATVNDRLFVNNVSLGVYAEIVQSDDYRDAKVEVARQHVRRTLGRRGETFDLQYTAPSGHEIDGAFLVMVSNNPYVLEVNPEAAQRRQLDTGRLGVFAISTKTGAQAAALVTLSALGLRNISRVWYEFAPTDFEVRSRSGSAYLGVDGEALEFATPLRFEIHPGGLRMYVPKGNLEAAERRRARAFGVADVARVARGIEPYEAAKRRRAAQR